VRHLTLANQLTILRMLLIPAVVLLVVYGYLGAALSVFLVAGATDALDGLIARFAGQRTSLGAWLDPMADKLLAVSTFIVLTLPTIPLTHRIPLWLTILIISRDVGIVGVVAVVNLAVGHRTFRPSVLGKMATASYVALVVTVMYVNWRREDLPLAEIMTWVALALTLASSADYVLRVRRLVNGAGAESKTSA